MLTTALEKTQKVEGSTALDGEDKTRLMRLPKIWSSGMKIAWCKIKLSPEGLKMEYGKVNQNGPWNDGMELW